MPPETYPPRSASGAPSASGGERLLRDVVESDLDAFYEQQRDPEATRMALFPARDRPAFDELAELVDLVAVRPLHAWVAPSNVASVRVLEKCDFVFVETWAQLDERLGEELELHLYELA
jgi:hypothetical protein